MYIQDRLTHKVTKQINLNFSQINISLVHTDSKQSLNMKWLKLLLSTLILKVYVIQIVSGNIQISSITQSLGNPIEEGKDVSFRAELTTQWDKCIWEKDGREICTQSPGSTSGSQVACKIEQTSRSSYVSGGQYDPNACKLEIRDFDRDDSGNWSVQVFEIVNNLDLYSDTLYFTAYSTAPPEVSFDQAGTISLQFNENMYITCKARNGRPDPIGFEWRLDGKSQFGQTLENITIDYPDDYGFHQVSQILRWTADDTEATYKLRCISKQPNGLYTDEFSATIEIEVTKRGRGLDSGWIAFIVIACCVFLIILIILIILWWSGRLVCACVSKKSKKKEEEQRVAEDKEERIRRLQRARMQMQMQIKANQSNANHLDSNKFNGDSNSELQLSPNRFSPINKPNNYSNGYSSHNSSNNSISSPTSSAPPPIPDRHYANTSAFKPYANEENRSYKAPSRAPSRAPSIPVSMDESLSFAKSPQSKSPYNGHSSSNTVTLNYPHKQLEDDGKGYMV